MKKTTGYLFMAASTVFSLLVGVVAAGASSAEVGGLGNYGPTGPITAENAGNPDVSEETLQVAQSDALGEVRAQWSETSDFVAEVGYQLAFRRAYDYLDDSPDRIADVLSDRENASRMALHQLGLYLTDEEWQEFDRRAKALARSLSVRDAIVGEAAAREIAEERPGVEFGPEFGGRWQDHLDGGVVKIGIVEGTDIDRNALKAMMERPEDLEFVDVSYSWDDIVSFARLAAAAARSQGIAYTVSPHAPINKVIVTVADPSYESPSSIPSDAIVVVHDPDEASPDDLHLNFTSDHSVLQQSPGLKVYMINSGEGWDNGGCTWGMTGHTTSYNYVVTNGHCVIDPPTTSISGELDVEVWQNGTDGTRISDANDPYVVARDHDLSDSARIQADPYGDTNCYHTESSSCGFTMTSRRSLYNYAVGQAVCAAFGQSNDYLCPNISKLIGTYFDDYRLQFPRIDGKPNSGDSGSGMKFANTWDGIAYAKDTTYAYFYPAYSVKTDLQFDFNCVTGGNPSGWGSCPLGDPN